MDCIFCEIVKKNIESNILYEDEDVLAFKDVNPAAPVHFLVIPKKHIESLYELNEQDFNLIAKVFEVIKKLAKDLDLKDGLRVINNCKKDGGQTVGHIHFHVLAKRQLNWPPGWFC